MLRFTGYLALVLIAVRAEAVTLNYDFDSGPGPGLTIFDGGSVSPHTAYLGPATGLWTIDTDGPDLRISKSADAGTIFPNDYIGAGVFSQFQLDGDFTVTVDFTLHNFPAGTGVQLNESFLNLRSDGGHAFDVLRFRVGSGNKIEVFAEPVGGPLGVQNSTLTSGRYRITRAGSTMTGFFAPSGSSSFTTIASQSGYFDPMRVQLFAAQGPNAGGSTRPFTALDISFDNLVIEADSIVQPVPEPNSLILAGFVLLLLLGYAWCSRRGVLIKAACSFVVFVSASSTSDAAWISDWFSFNGHQYRLTEVLDWETAQTLAESVNGNLVAINDAAEDAWVFDTFSPLAPDGSIIPAISPLPYRAYWIGGIQLSDSVEPDQGWSWVNGEPFVYQNWSAGEPNDSGGFLGNENRISVNELGLWNDLPVASAIQMAAVVEKPIPEPSSYTLSAIGLLALVFYKLRWRSKT
ncbi:MAG: PEP-CTERM sorting domain-containing protein [Planctomycetota bacterium]|nr:MAG: PEP-CTERM sorting domain-containing protein [Planctomycetota bacterium]REJ89546.1 MAG: PEP-CTERM sorting domain-containing protein [Planctomycetota bacterium]REK31409.1 MAG: PEP-CTERM sorting domain-containing protein [Planctomycetota bacterium]REK40639.1 MAG: PEP-CTERM sorting domain-containing protein [Planctomycetota bacterium]